MHPLGILHPGAGAAAGGGGGGALGASAASLGSAAAPAPAQAADASATRPTTISWNEGVIAEHDKERGTRRKILEPKTPYRAPSSALPSSREYGSAASVCSAVSDEDGMNQVPPEQLAAALQVALEDATSETGSACALCLCRRHLPQPLSLSLSP